MSNDSQKKARTERLHQEQMDNRLSSESRARSQANRRSKETVKKESSLVFEIYRIMSNKSRGVLLGLIFGTLISTALILGVMKTDEMRLIGILPMLTFPIIGLGIGAVLPQR